jgi:hypothetical protein
MTSKVDTFETEATARQMALEGLLAALGNWIDTPDDEYLEEAREHYQKLLATEIGTALIRQAEERGDG